MYNFTEVIYFYSTYLITFNKFSAQFGLFSFCLPSYYIINVRNKIVAPGNNSKNW